MIALQYLGLTGGNTQYQFLESFETILRETLSHTAPPHRLLARRPLSTCCAGTTGCGGVVHMRCDAHGLVETHASIRRWSPGICVLVRAVLTLVNELSSMQQLVLAFDAFWGEL